MLIGGEDLIKCPEEMSLELKSVGELPEKRRRRRGELLQFTFRKLVCGIFAQLKQFQASSNEFRDAEFTG
ncbi:hypothetical protein VNO77_45155 [Canavalia gladiata]|uniref:Uncharacterized protein n=1 Tax=Canavalia gladiata TaxID=3824 RepID=A0AAN9JSB0_CANGL